MHILISTLLLATVVEAQAASAAFLPFGSGCTLEGQALAIGNVGLPQIGQSFQITYTGPNHTQNFAQQSSWPQLALGFQSQQFPIPTSWFPQQPAGCVGLIQPDALVPMPLDASGTAYETNFSMSIPNVPGLIGVQFFAQWINVHQQCGFAGCGIDAVAISDAAIVVLGL
jgi:hypothetical protein